MERADINIVIGDSYKKLEKECIDKIATYGMTPNRTVTIIREYNRKWNDLCLANQDLAPDGFLKLLKKKLLERNFPSEYKTAFEYL